MRIPFSKRLLSYYSCMTISGVILSFIVTTTTHAAPMSSAITQPIVTTTNFLEQVVTPVVNPTASEPIAEPALNDEVAATQSTETAPVTDNDELALSPTAASSNTSTAVPVVRNLQNQGVSASSGSVLYDSNRISSDAANVMYRIAGVVAIIGFALYATTVIPRISNKPKHPLRKLVSSLNVKINQIQ